MSLAAEELFVHTATEELFVHSLDEKSPHKRISRTFHSKLGQNLTQNANSVDFLFTVRTKNIHMQGENELSIHRMNKKSPTYYVAHI